VLSLAGMVIATIAVFLVREVLAERGR